MVDKNRGLGLLYILLAGGLVVAFSVGVGASDQILPVVQTINWGSLVGAEIAPNLFVECVVRGFTFYIDDVGNRRQGDFGFSNAGLFTEFSVVSRNTGVTIETFEQEIRLQCDSSFALQMNLIGTATQFVSSTNEASNFITDIFATDINGAKKLVGTKSVTISPQIVPNDREILIGKVVFSTQSIEDAIAPTERATRAGAGGVDTSIQQFDSQISFDTDYLINIEIEGAEWQTFGEVNNGYKVTWINDDFTAGTTTPTSTDIKLILTEPTTGLLNDNNQIILTAVLPLWTQSEGNPTFKVTSEQTGATLATTIMSLSSSNDIQANFFENVLLRTDEKGKFKITVTSTGRVPATALLSTTDPTGGTAGGNNEFTTKACVVPIGFVDSALITGLAFLTGSCLEDVQKTCSSGLIPVLNTCIPSGVAGLLQGFNLIILFVVLIVIAIFIKIAIAIARKPKAVARAFIPTGL